MRSFLIHNFRQILLGDQIREDEIGGAFNKRERDKKCEENFSETT
jgi:hypothetical protein